MSGPSGNPPCPACGRQMRFKLPTSFINYLHWACPACGHVERYEQEFRDKEVRMVLPPLTEAKMSRINNVCVGHVLYEILKKEKEFRDQ